MIYDDIWLYDDIWWYMVIWWSYTLNNIGWPLGPPGGFPATESHLEAMPKWWSWLRTHRIFGDWQLTDMNHDCALTEAWICSIFSTECDYLNREHYGTLWLTSSLWPPYLWKSPFAFIDGSLLKIKSRSRFESGMLYFIPFQVDRIS